VCALGFHFPLNNSQQKTDKVNKYTRR
jgi:hypothetical protein